MLGVFLVDSEEGSVWPPVIAIPRAFDVLETVLWPHSGSVLKEQLVCWLRCTLIAISFQA